MTSRKQLDIKGKLDVIVGHNLHANGDEDEENLD